MMVVAVMSPPAMRIENDLTLWPRKPDGHSGHDLQP
jgi:hypothetical protein